VSEGRILVIDDSEFVLARVKSVLAAAGYDVQTTTQTVGTGRYLRNCDLVLRDPSVSKLHAHFRTRENGKFDLVDLDSQNGTCVNGIQLSPNKPEPVWPGDTVSFGNVTAWLLDAGALFDLMK